MIRKQPIVIDSYLKLKLRPSTLEQSECGIVFQLQYYTLKSEEQVMVPNSELVSAKFPLSHAAISAPQLLNCEALFGSV